MRTSTSKILLLVLACALEGLAGGKKMNKTVNAFLKENKKLKTAFEIKENNFNVALQRLRRSGLVEKNNLNFWKLTKKGREEADSLLKKEFIYKKHREKTKNIRNIIITFDIPEYLKEKRNYLRLELVSLGFNRLHKSVWIGGGPLPIEFMNYIKVLGLIQYIHIFKIQEMGTITNYN